MLFYMVVNKSHTAMRTLIKICIFQLNAKDDIKYDTAFKYSKISPKDGLL